MVLSLLSPFQLVLEDRHRGRQWAYVHTPWPVHVVTPSGGATGEGAGGDGVVPWHPRGAVTVTGGGRPGGRVARSAPLVQPPTVSRCPASPEPCPVTVLYTCRLYLASLTSPHVGRPPARRPVRPTASRCVHRSNTLACTTMLRQRRRNWLSCPPRQPTKSYVSPTVPRIFSLAVSSFAGHPRHAVPSRVSRARPRFCSAAPLRRPRARLRAIPFERQPMISAGGSSSGGGGGGLAPRRGCQRSLRWQGRGPRIPRLAEAARQPSPRAPPPSPVAAPALPHPPPPWSAGTYLVGPVVCTAVGRGGATTRTHPAAADQPPPALPSASAGGGRWGGDAAACPRRWLPPHVCHPRPTRRQCRPQCRQCRRCRCR